MQQGDQDPRARATDRVSDAYGDSNHIHHGTVQFQDPVVGQGDDRKGLVDFKEVDMPDFKACAPDGQGNGVGGCRCEPFGGFFGAGLPQDPRHGGQPQGGGLGFRNEQQRGGTIVDRTGVGGRDGPFFKEDRSQAPHLLEIHPVQLLIGGHVGRHAFAIPDLHRNDLGIEPAAVACL